MNPNLEHLLIYFGCVAAAWFVFTYFWPRLLISVFKRGLLKKGFGEGPVPLNTFYTEPVKVFAEPITAQLTAGRNLMTTGVNHDTLLSMAWLDLRGEPIVLHVPDMKDRYYSVQFINPMKNTNFAYVGTRATGNQAGDYLITGRGWKGHMPEGLKHISAPVNSVGLGGRVLVKNDDDVETAHDLSKQMTLTPLSQWKPR